MIATLDSSPRESFAKADNDRNAHAVVRIAQKAADKENLIVSPGTSTADETVDADLKFSNSGRWDGLPPSAPALTVSIGTPGRMEALRYASQGICWHARVICCLVASFTIATVS